MTRRQKEQLRNTSMNDLPLDNKDYYKCESCGGFHSAEETEVAIVRIIKGKNCALVPPKIERPFKVESGSAGAVGLNPDAPTGNATPFNQPPRKPMIPPGMVGMMYPPGHPQHEQLGAKESRNV